MSTLGLQYEADDGGVLHVGSTLVEGGAIDVAVDEAVAGQVLISAPGFGPALISSEASRSLAQDLMRAANHHCPTPCLGQLGGGGCHHDKAMRFAS